MKTLIAYISIVLACGIVSAAPSRNLTQADLARLLGPTGYMDLRLDFPCTDTAPSPTVPTSAHKLRPADIKYIAAIGDSLTAASGGDASNIFGLLTQYRGLSWSMGGQEDLKSTVTLPNIFRNYNPDLYGQSTGNGDKDSANARFNAAVPGAVSSDMPGQAQALVDKMLNQLGKDEFEQSWKLVTLFIGGNDLCAACDDTTAWSAANYIKNVEAALKIFYDQMPRTFVNLVTVLNVGELQKLHEGLVCQGMQFFLCRCAIDANTVDLVYNMAVDYQTATKDLIAKGTFDDKDDFTVVLQPFMEHMSVPTTSDGLADFSYFSVDCFHFSKKGHGAAAIELWNNMMEPVGKKTTLWRLDDTFHCPTSAEGYIYTAKNSN